MLVTPETPPYPSQDREGSAHPACARSPYQCAGEVGGGLVPGGAAIAILADVQMVHEPVAVEETLPWGGRQQRCHQPGDPSPLPHAQPVSSPNPPSLPGQSPTLSAWRRPVPDQGQENDNAPARARPMGHLAPHRVRACRSHCQQQQRFTSHSTPARRPQPDRDAKRASTAPPPCSWARQGGASGQQRSEGTLTL